MTLRTSGTEPKLKYYVEHATSDPDVTKRCVQARDCSRREGKRERGEGRSRLARAYVRAGRRELDEIIHEMMERMLQPGKYGLKMPKDE